MYSNNMNVTGYSPILYYELSLDCEVREEAPRWFREGIHTASPHFRRRPFT